MSENRQFTLEELKQFDGKEGRPAYVAVDGVVYDATQSKLWRNGTHVRVHQAGSDLSGALLVAPHPRDRVDNLPKVGVVTGVVQAPAQAKADTVPAFARLSYAMHGHPASVHFPIAMMVFASLLHIVAVVMNGGWICPTVTGPCGVSTSLCAQVAWYNLIFGTLLAPVSIVTGLIDWVYQFGARLTALFTWKIVLSVVFMALAGGAVLLGLLDGGMGVAGQVMVVLLAPVALGLGFVGGRITFPTA